MNLKLLISFLFLATGGIFTMQRQLQMLQQNSYYPSRYYKWLKNSSSFITVISIALAVILGTLTFINAWYLIIPITLVSLIFRVLKQQKNHKSSIKKLVYTPRVKRLIITSILLYCGLGLLSLIIKGGIYKIIFVCLILVSQFPHFVMLLALLVNKPVESLINRRFINDAKRILSKNKLLLTVGITGSYGKTSVKFILNRILSEAFNVTATPESFNTPMGIVRTVREHMKPQTEIFIAEMGAKNIGDIKELCELADPTIGIITAVGPQHLETFGSVENVAKTKFELADHCLLKSDGKLYVNLDSSPIAKHIEGINNKNQIISFGTSENADCRAENINFSPEGTSFDVVYNDNKFSLSCKLLGRHSVTNILGAVAMALDLGVSEKNIRFAVSSLKPASHRLEIKPFINKAVLIDDAYNSNPEGCLEAVRVLGSFKGMRRIIVTPGLVELGTQEYECNKRLGLEAAKYCDDIILVGKKRAIPIEEGVKEAAFNTEHLIIAESFKQAMEYLGSMTDQSTVVLFENDLPDNYAG